MEKTKFVIHEHDAKTAGLHWDLRIKRGSRLKSWAIPKHRVPEKHERLFAAETPDHSLVWYDYQGTIDDGYGKGTVKIYDQGICKIFYWKNDAISFELQGKKIKGRFMLVKMQDFGKGKKRPSWLFIRKVN